MGGSTLLLLLIPPGAAPPPTGNVVADHRYIPARRPRGITVHLRGTGTGWTGSTTFTLSGVAGCSVLTKIVNSATAATLVIATGASIGTLTISDGTNSTTLAVKHHSSARRWFAGLGCPR